MSQDKQGLVPFKALLVLLLSHVPLGLAFGVDALDRGAHVVLCSGLGIVSLVKEVKHEVLSRPW